MQENIERNRGGALYKIIRNNKNIKYDLEKLNNTIKELSGETVSSMRFRNFVPEYLSKLFDAIQVEMPKIVYTIEFVGPYQTIRISTCGLFWTIMNNNNEDLYYPNLNAFFKTPIAAVVPIFIDLITMLGYNQDGAIEMTIQEKK